MGCITWSLYKVINLKCFFEGDLVNAVTHMAALGAICYQ